MALPHENCVGGDVCCSSLFDQATAILDLAIAAVEGCSVVDCDLPDLVSYVSMGSQIADPYADYLVVSLQGVAPVPPPANARGNMPNPVLHRATFQVKLLETGWPMPTGDGDEIIPPAPNLYHNVARHAYAHGEAMYRAIANGLAVGTICGGDECFKRLEPLRPSEPQGGVTGWITNVVLGTNYRGG